VARYSLIIKDSVYVTLVQEAAKQGKTLGKLLNEILNREAELFKGGVPQQAICVVCGCKATLEAHGRGQQRFFVCGLHRELARRVGRYREL